MPRKRKRSPLYIQNFVLTSDDLIKDTTEKEKHRVLEVCTRLGKRLYSLFFTTGAISLFLATEYFLGARLVLASELRILFLATVGFIGAVNILCGLLLLAKE